MSIETPEYAAMLKRMVRAYGRRVADADYVDLTVMLEVQAELEEALVVAVAGLVERGVSWATIGEGLGITRQSAHARFSRRVAERSQASA